MVGLVFCFTFSLCARASLYEVFFFPACDYECNCRWCVCVGGVGAG